jgi:undecaprenyl-diphosphatase
MPLWIAALLGIVEGLTEFLPVSSTGHLIVADALLGRGDDKAFEVVIQSGAILAVVVHYRALLAERLRGLFSSDPRARQLVVSLVVAFLPAAILGLLFSKKIKAVLFGVMPVAWAWIVGGVVMIAIERFLAARDAPAKVETLDAIDTRHALGIGLFQCFALIPGTSRSMSTILGGRLLGLSTNAAAEFSFLLAIPVLGAATVHDMVKERHALLGSQELVVALLVGFAVSFVVALVVIRGFLAMLKRFGLEAFGVYRIIAGAAVIALLRSH